MTNIFNDFRQLVVVPALDDLVSDGSLPSGLDWCRVTVEPPRDPAHGDLATNAAMVMAGPLKFGVVRSSNGFNVMKTIP